MLRDKPHVRWCDLSGGEPVLQAEALLPLLVGVRDSGLTTVCYTGYSKENSPDRLWNDFWP